MFLGEEFEKFAASLRGYKAPQLRKLAASEGFELPNIPNRDILLQELFALKNGLPSPLAEETKKIEAEYRARQPEEAAALDRRQEAGPPAAMPVEPTSLDAAAGSEPIQKPEPHRIVRARRARYFCVRETPWTSRPERIPVSRYDDWQWKRICDDKQMIVRDEV